MNMADRPQRDTAERLALEESLAALDTTASALSSALLTLARTRKEINDILHSGRERSRQDELRWSCD